MATTLTHKGFTEQSIASTTLATHLRITPEGLAKLVSHFGILPQEGVFHRDQVTLLETICRLVRSGVPVAQIKASFILPEVSRLIETDQQTQEPIIIRGMSNPI